MRRTWITAVVALLTLTLTSCSIVTPDKRPDDQKLRDGINLLLRDFSDHHAPLMNWDVAMVKQQISHPLPQGYATEAGWTLEWQTYVQGELNKVVIPWSIIGQLPNKFAMDIDNYSGGKIVPQSTEIEVRRAQQGKDYYLAGIVHIRASQSDPNWIIFTSVPYLPFTDTAYGFAHRADGKWSVNDFGTATVGCGHVPNSIIAEFGMSCPPGSN